MPGMQAGDEASYAEWEDVPDYCSKYQGTRNAAGARHGVVREIDGYGNCIREQTFYEDKKHGLSFVWDSGYGPAFTARIFDHGEEKAGISWNDDWSEWESYGNTELILQNNGLSLFKP